MTVLIGFVVVALLAVAADRLVARIVEGAVAQAVAAELGAGPDVDVGGLGAGVAALVGRVDRLVLTAPGVPLEAGGQLRDLRAEIVDVRLEGDRAVAGTGDFTGRLGPDDLAAVVGPAAPLLVLQDGALIADLGIAQVPLELRVAPGGQALSLVPAGADPAIAALVAGLLEIPLDLPAGVTLRSAVVEGDALRVTGGVDAAALAGS